MEKKILNISSGAIEEIKISAFIWSALHFNKRQYFYKKDRAEFLKRNNLKPTIFNLNCLEELGGVILTDLQIMKGGIKK